MTEHPADDPRECWQTVEDGMARLAQSAGVVKMGRAGLAGIAARVERAEVGALLAAEILAYVEALEDPGAALLVSARAWAAAAADLLEATTRIHAEVWAELAVLLPSLIDANERHQEKLGDLAGRLLKAWP